MNEVDIADAAKPSDRPIDYGRLPDYLGYQIRQAQSAVFRDFAHQMADLGVTPGEFGLLSLLERNPGITQVQLAAVYRLDKSTLSLAVSGLVKRGLAQRTRNARDQRFYGLSLTAAGRDLLAKVTGRVEEQERLMDAALHPGEREHLLDLLRRIAAAFQR